MGQAIHIPDATTQPEAYVQALLDTLGNREPLEVYGATRDAVSLLCTELSEEAWSAVPDPGEWSAHDLVGHLLDVDIVYGFRWRLTLTADVPAYPGYDERAFAALPKLEPSQLLRAFLALRTANLALMSSIPPRIWRRQAIHGEQGREDLDRMIRKVAGHDLAHLDQLRRTVARTDRPASTTTGGAHR